MLLGVEPGTQGLVGFFEPVLPPRAAFDPAFFAKIEGRFEVDTFNGDIDNCFGPKAKRTSKYTPGWELEFVEGNGDARITITTLNGDVTICR